MKWRFGQKSDRLLPATLPGNATAAVAVESRHRVSEAPSEPENASGLLNRLREVVEGRWDLTTRFPSDSVKTPGLIGRLLNALFEKLSRSLTNCASNTIALSKISPQLAAVATDLAASSQVQAARAQEIAAAVGLLHSASANLKAITNIIERTAFQTKLLAVNASIEATRAGEHGRAFAAVAEEIQRLSHETSEATGNVATVLGSIQEQIRKTAQAVGIDSANNPLRKSSARDSLSELAGSQADQAALLNRLAKESNAASDELVIAMGIFRIAAHDKAKRLVEDLVLSPDLATFDRDQQERALRKFILEHPAFELLYVTDWNGRQITKNIGAQDFEAAYKTDGLGNDWSARPWFRGARETSATFVSDVYRSAASGDFCFTVSTPIRDRNEKPFAILGADVRLEHILGSGI